MSIAHHLDDATLMSLAAGTLTPALAVVAASHVTLCRHCQIGLTALESVGAALLADLHRVPLASKPAPMPVHQPQRVGAQTALPSDLPLPLARLVGRPLKAVRWRPLSFGIWHHRIALAGADAGELHLIRAAPGYGLPAHGHNGAELTLVLRGAYQDEVGRFHMGDAADLDQSIEHRPVADAAAGCICALACERPARFQGLLPRLLQPLFGL